MNRNKTSKAVGWCYYHGKLLYTDRKRAKSVARQHPDHKSVYACSDQPTLFHVGGLPQEVLHGEMTRDEFFGPSDVA